MGRPKGSMNKKLTGVQLEFEESDKIKPDEVKMEATQEVTEEDVDLVLQELDQARIELENTKREIEAKKLELKTMPVQSTPVKDAPAVIARDESAKQRIAEQKARDKVEVTGKFYNLRVKGQSVKLPYQKYGDEPVKWHNFDHGKIYTIPKGFADQINGGTESDPCYYTPHFIKNEGVILNPDDPETGIHEVDTSDKKYSFVPLSF